MANNNNNTKTLNISVVELMVRPIDNSSKLMYEHPGTDLFDARNDFMIFKTQQYVAVYITFMNNSLLSNSPRAQRGSVNVSLIDDTTGDMVKSDTVKVNMSRNELSQSVRLDLPLTFGEVNTRHSYKVTVCHPESAQSIGYHDLRMFAMSRIRMLPTKWFSAASACVDINENPADSQVTFQLVCNIPDSETMLPEVQIRLVDHDGKERTECVTPECLRADSVTAADNAPSRRYNASMKFFFDRGMPGVRYAEVHCMGHAFAGFLFDEQGIAKTGTWATDSLKHISEYTAKRGRQLLDIARKEAMANSPEETPATTAANPARLLDELTGVSGIKTKLTEYTQLMRFNRLRQQSGLPVLSVPLHSMFLGSPGTGKTTVARIMGQMLHQAGVLSKGHVVVRERASLMGKYYHSEAENTIKALEEAQGGILFIDEAYQLHQPHDEKDPGRFVIETLLTALADESRRDWMLIMAGYTEPMKRMFSINPGLKSRIPESNIYTFEDFTESELMEIALNYFTRNRYQLSHSAHSALAAYMAHTYANKATDFGNARFVINLIQTRILPAMASRLANVDTPTAHQLCTIEATDIPRPAMATRPQRFSVGFKIA